MSPLNFPNDPSATPDYESPGGGRWTWDASKNVWDSNCEPPPSSIIWSDWSWCYNLSNNQKIIPRPEKDSDRHRTYTNTFDGGTYKGWYLYRPNNINKVQWRYEPPASINLYARTLRLFCGTQGKNGKSRIWVNGSERSTRDHVGYDMVGAWTDTFTINGVITSIEIRQKSGTGYDSFGVYAVEVNGVILTDGDLAPPA